MKRIIPLLLVVGSLVFTASCNQKSQNPRPLSEEESRIESVLARATFQDLEGNEVLISDFEGSVVLVDFWETWCGPCLMVFPAMDSLKAEYGDDFTVLAVNTLGADTKEDVEQFANENEYNFVQLLDINDVGSEVISMGIPFKIYFDPDGYLIKAELGSAGTQGDYEKAKVIIEDNKKS